MILLTGATGNIGRELMPALTAAGAEFRVLVRDPAKVSRLAGARIFVGDLDEPSTLAPAFEGVDQLFLLVPGVGLDHARHAVAAAERSGVKRIVQLSSFHAALEPRPAMGSWHHEREELVRAGGIPATVLRPGGYMSNALQWAPAIRAGRPVDDPTGPGRYAPIDPADIAAVAARVLTESGHEGKSYNLTGSETFTVAEQVEVLAAELSRPVEVRTAATAEAALRSRYPNGAPPALAAAILEWFTIMRADTVGFRTDTVGELLGRPPRTFDRWCRAHRADFV
ncbi:NAD(P)H-binding protein [Nocardia yamanashiensis]|uniref:NAD(P)H-binding protein n=1 Tax=Nocardia yamanashiensis TaxID=209247 RepID=UPI001E463D0F|nr:NAD(P)H-binding protein [Nocardia yamanashiensis]UGT45968.1 NAD(P)H-binding protein [Nocardia yamanashiensis]